MAQNYTDRRKHQRIEIVQAIFIEVVSRRHRPESENTIIRCETVDVSVGGLKVYVQQPIVQGSKLNIAVPMDDWKENLWRFVSFDYPDRQEVVVNIDKYFGRFAEILTETPWELRDETIDDQLWNEVNITPLVLKIQTPALERVGQIAWRLKSGREALLTVLAVKRYEKEKGGYPAGLDELVEADYLKKLPMDPYSDGPLVYRRTESGFLLYSLGTNLTDEGGELGLRGGKRRMWSDDGDWIFWPVAE